MSDDAEPDARMLLSAVTTEHFVLQTATSATYTEASARSSLYVMSLSSALVAIGFLAERPSVLVPFMLTVLPTIFVLGLFTVIRLVETSLESMRYLRAIARIRAHYRSLGSDAERLFAARLGRWPEVPSPATRGGSTLAFLGTTATMVAVLNNVLGGVCAAVAMSLLAPNLRDSLVVGLGLAVSLVLTFAFVAYQRWRFADDARGSGRAESATATPARKV
jgi:hypothetical protein